MRLYNNLDKLQIQKVYIINYQPLLLTSLPELVADDLSEKTYICPGETVSELGISQLYAVSRPTAKQQSMHWCGRAHFLKDQISNCAGDY